MIDKKFLKVGDAVQMIYQTSFAAEAQIRPMVVTKIDDDFIYAKYSESHKFNPEMAFINDDEMQYKNTQFSSCQHVTLFLGTTEEAKKFASERTYKEELFIELQDALENWHKLSVNELKEIIKILKREE